MNTLNIISKIKTSVVCMIAGMVLLGLAACNKDFAFRLNFDENPNEGGARATEYKVAYIVVEGGVGTIVGQQASDAGAMPTLGKLTANAMVSWNGVSAANKQSLTSYADLLTGTEYAKHQVAGDGSGNNLTNYPTLLKRIADDSDIRTAFISSNANLGVLVQSGSVDNYAIETNDANVTTKVVEELKRDDAGVVVATFKGVDAAGQASGYDSEAYIQALSAFDQQLKSITDAIYARENYSGEQWLIIVTSTKGGQYTLPAWQDDGSIFADPERNNFVVMNNKQFAFQIYERMETVDPAWVSSAVRYSGASGSGVLPVEEAALYNFGTGANAGDYTIQLKLKIHEMNGRNGKSGTPLNGVILGKMKNAANFPAGWAITYNGGSGWRFVSNSSTSSNWGLDGELFDLDTWYTLTVKLYQDGSNRTVKVFRNGVLKHTVTNFAARNMSSTDPLQVGFQEGSYGSNGGFVHSIADIRIYKTAIPDAVISDIYCTTIPKPTSPFYNDLIGYWPGNDGGNELKDRSGNNRHFDLTGTYVWANFSERAASLCPTLPDDIERYVVRSVDAPRLILSWLNVKNIDEFDLDSQIWNPSFTNP